MWTNKRWGRRWRKFREGVQWVRFGAVEVIWTYYVRFDMWFHPRGSTLQKPRTLFLETQRILENPQGFRQNPGESRESPWFRLHKVIKNPQESFGIPRNPQESPGIPSESPESSRILRILRIFPRSILETSYKIFEVSHPSLRAGFAVQGVLQVRMTRLEKSFLKDTKRKNVTLPLSIWIYHNLCISTCA